MNRRGFVKWLGLLAASAVLPLELARPATRAARNLKAALLGEVHYVRPAVMPKVIMIFLYGGPSELAGNLTNIAEINANSQNPYPTNLLPTTQNNIITPNYFWGGGAGGAGGETMESLIASGEMSVYRTIHRIKEDSKAHGPSVFQNLVGSLDMAGPGIGTTLAAILAANQPFGKPVEELLLPFVSFEGDSVIYRTGDLTVPLRLKPVALDSGFRNPYERSANGFVSDQEPVIEALSRQVSGALGEKGRKVIEAFEKRAELDAFIKTSFSTAAVNQSLPQEVDANGVPIVDVDNNPVRIQYPNTNFGNRLKAAISLAITNPDTYFISLGSGGLGGWDDHSDAIPEYTARIRELMDALAVAAKHMRLAGRNDIVINVFGDFGRNVNLNNSIGWDHGNNQNLYTLGGAAVRPGALGKVVGKTQRIGTPFQNRQFTAPTDDSYQCEPFAIASSLYKYYGVQNPEILTGEPPIDEINPPNQRV
ncbi:DUF1501 domain-containing protein [Candidatus Manganitrophus noduliformans]|uniref:DUF1501 domain-containing protein n=1 Tax=Candidatus Manganitrophus noduliformans TaxID=2606439 RepID=A0A7X6DR02_9BACT|nr:DUF1501 domain-containing protein [Candidatus Manganitrophus noduliformans]NKE71803.1 DUF1501 domain-containing protein [Candidatus Manganitrophus noduliformans]